MELTLSCVLDWCFVVLGFFMRFEDDSLESAKTVKQWNVKIISVSVVLLDLVGCFDLSYLEWDMSISVFAILISMPCVIRI